MLFEIVMEGTSSGGHGVSVINEQRILIVDDDREFRRSLTKIFEKAGFQVNAASTGNQAGALLGKNAYDLIILDWRLPGKSGLDCLREIKRKSPQSKVIVVTVNSDAASYELAMAAGAFDYLCKPVKRQTIFASARRAMKYSLQELNANTRRQEMLAIKRILFPTDFSRCADQALNHALYLARQYRADLHILHVMVPLEYDANNPSHQFPDMEAVQTRLNDVASARMNAALSAREVSDLRISQAQLQGISIAPTILEYADDHSIDLIVMGTHGRRGLKHLFLGSVTEEVVRLAPCPVLTIRERKESMAVEAIKSILVPIDFSEHSRDALIYAKQFASAYGAHMHLLHVIETNAVPPFYVGLNVTGFDSVADIKARTETALQQLLAETAGPNVASTLHILEGYPAHDIVHFAEKHSMDYIVIATHGLTGFKHLLLGSVAEKVVRRAPCPVFTVKAFGKSLIE